MTGVRGSWQVAVGIFLKAGREGQHGNIRNDKSTDYFSIQYGKKTW